MKSWFATSRLRPFSNVHGVPLLILMASWEWWLVSARAYGTFPPYGAALTTFTLTSVFWHGYIQGRPIGGLRGLARVVGRQVRDTAIAALWILLVAALLSYPADAYRVYLQSKVRELVSSENVLSQMKTIAGRAVERRSLSQVGVGLELASTAQIASGAIGENGTIAIRGKERPVVLVLQPSLDNGRVRWKCFGMPERIMPDGCRLSDAVFSL